MDVEDYRAARRTRLVGLATDLGVPADEAGSVVDRVIEAQRRRILRADDPDDVVVPALREEVLGRPRSRLVPAVILALAAVVVAAFALALVPDPDERPDDPPVRTATVPSLLGLTTEEATSLLVRNHVAVAVRAVPQCNPAGQVLGSVPSMGTTVTSDEVVTVIATAAPTWTCPDDEGARDTAWALLRFLLSGTARPDFADTVSVHVDGTQVGAVRSTDLGSSGLWRTVVRDPVVQYVARPAPNDLGQPVVSVTPRRGPSPTTCGRPSARPLRVAGRSTRIVLTAGGRADVRGCGLTIDLVEDGRGRVAAVALAGP
ncbi:PASTA domain-containing protein [Nocardioides zeicaulis]|uniref:PASTA domain-containing protein n=1 Tax=Nocardioides zeicaulis TaxID=1776857 RepID=A0ABV6DYN1_9ACTN